MTYRLSFRRVLFSTLLFSILLLTTARVSADCDGLDGPVVKGAQRAFETGNVNLVLIWVRESDAAEIKTAFQKTAAVRDLNPQAREVADNYFFETLVRTHRAAEGAPYTGLKPAGRDLGPAVPAADRAIEESKLEPLLTFLSETVQEGMREQFRQVMTAKGYNENDILAGRSYVKGYVEFIHYVERLYEAAGKAAPGHFPEPRGAAADPH